VHREKEIIMKKTKVRNRKSLENEVIVAVVVLYLLIATVMLLVHLLQPAGQETVTSSMSPSHAEQSTKGSEVGPKGARKQP
jgi:hypothetical protein